MGDPRLLKIARPVDAYDTAELHALITDMKETMEAMDGAGLAAPQIGVDLRVVIFGGKPSKRYPQAAQVPYTILINPRLTPLGVEAEEGWEGCLSVPGLRGMVPRYVHLRYQGFDQYGAPIDRTVQDFHARVVQHEVDHLDGVLFPMRVRDMRRFGFTQELGLELTAEAEAG